MLLFVVAIVVVGAFIKKHSRIRVAKEVMEEYRAFRKGIRAQVDDPLMSDQKWRELLPICRFADERFETLCQGLPYEDSSEALVLMIIGDSEDEDALM